VGLAGMALVGVAHRRGVCIGGAGVAQRPDAHGLMVAERWRLNEVVVGIAAGQGLAAAADGVVNGCAGR
jgi:hypothetical protein